MRLGELGVGRPDLRRYASGRRRRARRSPVAGRQPDCRIFRSELLSRALRSVEPLAEESAAEGAVAEDPSYSATTASIST